MKLFKVGRKGVRLTAFEGDSIKVFLIQGPERNIDELFNVLQTRISNLKDVDKEKKATTSNDKNEDLEGTLV